MMGGGRDKARHCSKNKVSINSENATSHHNINMLYPSIEDMLVHYQ